MPLIQHIARSFVVFFIMIHFCFSQSSDQEDTLYQQVLLNQELLNTDMEQAFQNIESLLVKAVNQNDVASEMALLANKCRYYLTRQNVSELIKTAEHLYAQAVKYRDIRSQAAAKKYIADGFRLNGLYDRAIEELNVSLTILDRAKPNDDNIKNTRANTYISLANLYSGKKEYETAVEHMKLAGEEFNQLSSREHREFLKYLNDSNLAAMYTQLNSDSAYYYVQKSIAGKPESTPENNITMRRNYIILGIVHSDKQEYIPALTYLQKAEKLTTETGDRLNLAELYQVFIDVYNETGDHALESEYTSKLRELELELTRDKNLSLHQIIEHEKERQFLVDKANRRMIVTIILTSIGLILLIVVVFYLYRKRMYSKYDKLSQEFLENNKPTTPASIKIYSELIELVKKNDKSFMAAFKNIFPDFSNKLLAINPDFAQSEIEFSALLKLNLSTKEIAQYKFIQPKTVQNKKHRIRKRLQIPENIDIYQWFSEI
jgi:tetratricopeptide (TPR) repeat protein